MMVNLWAGTPVCIVILILTMRSLRDGENMEACHISPEDIPVVPKDRIHQARCGLLFTRVFESFRSFTSQHLRLFTASYGVARGRGGGHGEIVRSEKFDDGIPK